MMNRRAFELSIGTVVSLVLILIIFSASLYFIRQFFITIPATSEAIDQDTEAHIRDLLREGKTVALPLNKRTTVRGGQTTAWLGIENKLGQQNDFRLSVVFDTGFDVHERPLTTVEATHITNNWLLYNDGPYTIPNNAFKATLIRLKAGDTITADGASTPRGYYVFNVCVYHTALTPPCTQLQADATPDAFYTGKLYKLILEVV